MRVQKIIFFLLLLLSTSAIGQTIVQGVILDSNSDPLADVSISVKNFNLQTISDRYGKFEIFVPPNKFLELSKPGYLPKSIKVSNEVALPFIFRLREKKATDNSILVKGLVIDYQSKEQVNLK